MSDTSVTRWDLDELERKVDRKLDALKHEIEQTLRDAEQERRDRSWKIQLGLLWAAGLAVWTYYVVMITLQAVD